MLSVKKLLYKIIETRGVENITLAPHAGFSSYSYMAVYDKSNNRVRISFNFSKASDIAAGTILFTVPQEYRPSGTVYGQAMLASVSAAIGYRVEINASGSIVQYAGSTIRNGFGYLEYSL